MRDSTKQMQVFLCHSSGDKPVVRTLYQKLRSDGFAPWFDEENLLPGQDWQLEVPIAVRTSHVVLVCLSHSSIMKTGYVQKEIKYALDVADEQPEGTIYIVPVRLEECDVPQRLQRWHWVNYFEVRGYELLLRALHKRAVELKLEKETHAKDFKRLSQFYTERAFQYLGTALNIKSLKFPIMVSIVGLTGVGKSALINALTLGDYTSDSAEITTAGVIGNYRWYDKMVFMDIPGLGSMTEGRESEIYLQIQEKSDLILYVHDAQMRLSRDERRMIKQIQKVTPPFLLIVNRIDLIPDSNLENYLEDVEKSLGIPPLPISVFKDLNIDTLRQALIKFLGVSLDGKIS